MQFLYSMRWQKDVTVWLSFFPKTEDLCGRHRGCTYSLGIKDFKNRQDELKQFLSS